jgi:succinate dehydrogenase/fumarate reductase cytochrome b subunit (b558 family)
MRYHPYHAPLPPSDPSPLRRAFSISGALPLGAFLLVHLAVNLRALRGDEAFATTVAAMQRSRAVAVSEYLLVLAPLLLHGAIGVWLVARGEPLADPPPYSRVVAAWVRVTGVVAALFVAVHLVDLGFPVGPHHRDAATLSTVLSARLSSTAFAVPWRGAGYLVAVACVAFHFVTGCWGMYARTPHARADRGRLRLAAVAAIVVGVGITVGYADVVVFHATGARLLGGRAPENVPARACP